MKKTLLTILVLIFCSLTASSVVKGDVNGDNLVSSVDITALYNYLLNNDTSSIINGDQNGDGIISSVDITIIYNILLGNDTPDTGEITEYTVNGVTFKMVTVQGGTFSMGGTAEQGDDVFNSERPVHQVTLSSFAIGQTEVTQELWQAVMGTNPSAFNSTYYGIDLQRPVERVTWNDCQQFIAALNQLTGKTFRLLTEAEWEYAARGGNKSQGYKYSGSNDINEVALYWGNIQSHSVGTAGYGTQAVATRLPNELGIYDMSGNVLEWCSDWYGDYSGEAQTNPTGPESGYRRVLRGGSFARDADVCRVSCRDGWSPTGLFSDVGLRLAM